MSLSTCSTQSYDSVETAIMPEPEFINNLRAQRAKNAIKAAVAERRKEQDQKTPVLGGGDKKKDKKKRTKKSKAAQKSEHEPSKFETLESRQTDKYDFLRSSPPSIMSDTDREVLINIVKELIMLLQYERVKRSGDFDMLFFILVTKISAALAQIEEKQPKEARKVNDMESLPHQFSDFFRDLELTRTANSGDDKLPISPGSGIIKQSKITVPDHPNYNFIGRILGPRGISVRQLEAATGCGILIRGKGSVKNAQREETLRVRDAPGFEHLKEPLHVLITAEGITEDDAEQKLENCRQRIEKLLKPDYDDFKRRQLCELAIINGRTC